MAQFAFGSGVLWATALTDATGVAIATPSPLQFGTLREGSVEISQPPVPLYGSHQFPIAVGLGKGKISGKAKTASINAALWNAVFFGQTLTAGISSAYLDRTGTAIPGTPYQITPTVPGSGTWTQNLGVRNASGLPMTCVASSPATGQYSVSAGVYTFAAADTGLVVYIDYLYTASSTSARKSTVTNQLMGSAPSFSCTLYLPFEGKNLTITLHKCISTKLSLVTKQDDFITPEFDFEGFADAVGNTITYGTSE